jgi:hypothetical protein
LPRFVSIPRIATFRPANEWGTAPRRAAGEQDQDYPDFAVLAAAHRLDTTRATAPLSDHGLARVADSLYPIFAAPTQDATVAAVNDLLARGAQQPRLGRDGGALAGRGRRRLRSSCSPPAC